MATGGTIPTSGGRVQDWKGLISQRTTPGVFWSKVGPAPTESAPQDSVKLTTFSDPVVVASGDTSVPVAADETYSLETSAPQFCYHMAVGGLAPLKQPAAALGQEQRMLG